MEARRRGRHGSENVVAAPIVLLGDSSQSPIQPSPEDFEFQTTQNQPSPARVRGRGRPKKASTLALPSVVSSDSPATPLTMQSVRRSTRLNSKEGFCAVRLETKKRKVCPVKIDESTGQAGPIPLSILQGWGIECGIAPGELSDDALMQASSTMTDDADTTA